MTNNKAMSRMFNALITLFFATPFLFIFYSLIQQGVSGFDLQELLSSDPSINLFFIVSFITPFVGYYVLQLKHKLKDTNEGTMVSMYLVITAISFMIMGNMMYGLLVFVLIYFVMKNYKKTYKDIYQEITNKRIAIKPFVGPTLLFALSTIIRLMLTAVNNI